jgi:SAM-dependent methyltransferase
MHPTAMLNGKSFFDCYEQSFPDSQSVTVLDIGAQDVNGSLKQVCPPRFKYVGVDFVEGKGVDVILTDPYVLPFETGTADIVTASSCFEHSEMFWLVFLEIMRVLKPRGLFYLNVPSNGMVHRYPVDCWRFYPDSGLALTSWGRRNGMNVGMLESFVSRQYLSQQVADQWNDFVAVFIRDETHVQGFPHRIIQSKTDFFNGRLYGSSDVINLSDLTEDQHKLGVINQLISNHVRAAL